MANYTQKAILNEFEAMLTEMRFNKITVSSLVRRCEISSNTFYYHFRDIFDLLDTWLDIKKKIFLQTARPLRTWESILKLFLRTLKAHSVLVYHVSDSIPRERLEQYVFISIKSFFLDYVKNVSQNATLSEQKIQGLAEFCCYSFLGVMLEFIWGNMSGDIDATVDRIAFIFNDMFISAMQDHND